MHDIWETLPLITPFLWQGIVAEAYSAEADEFSLLYEDIRETARDYVNSLWQDAKKSGKPPILIFGEDHVDKDSLVWQIALLAAMHDISKAEGKAFLYYSEIDHALLENTIEYKDFIIEKNSRVARDIASSLGAQIVPIDEEKRGGGIDHNVDSIVLRDHCMASNLRKINAPAFVTVGYSHLMGLSALIPERPGIFYACSLTEEQAADRAKEISENAGMSRVAVEPSDDEVMVRSKFDLEVSRFLLSGKVDIFQSSHSIIYVAPREDYITHIAKLLGNELFPVFVEHRNHELYEAWKIQKLRAEVVANKSDPSIYDTLTVHYAALMELKTNQGTPEKTGLLWKVVRAIFGPKKQERADYTKAPDYQDFLSEIREAARIFPRMFTDYLNYNNLLCDALANSNIGIVEIAKLSKDSDRPDSIWSPPGFYRDCLQISSRSEAVFSNSLLKKQHVFQQTAKGKRIIDRSSIKEHSTSDSRPFGA